MKDNSDYNLYAYTVKYDITIKRGEIIITITFFSLLVIYFWPIDGACN